MLVNASWCLYFWQYILVKPYIPEIIFVGKVFFFFKYLFGRQRERERERSSINWFIPQMSTLLGLNQAEVRAENSIQNPACIITCCLPGYSQQEVGIKKEPGLTSRHSDVGCGHARQHLNCQDKCLSLLESFQLQIPFLHCQSISKNLCKMELKDTFALVQKCFEIHIYEGSSNTLQIIHIINKQCMEFSAI